MASVRTFLCLGLSLSAGIIKAADPNSKAENVRWTSLDFKTMLSWTTKTPEHSYTIRYSSIDGDWIHPDHCDQLSDHLCDMTEELKYYDRAFIADVLTDITDDDYDHGDYQHTESKPFNPYRETNISAVEFTVHAANESSMLINITDTLTSVHKDGKQLTIRDIFKHDLLYKINYHKAESTGKREKLSENSAAFVYSLDSGTRYCFMVAAVIKSRPPNMQQGAWSRHLCQETGGDQSMHELGPGAWVGLIFILLTVFIIFVTVTVLCCRNRRQKNNPPQTPQSQSSAPV
ncbi:tissue factor-like [Cheilinus undulatus]|uniref:tissue factor-like n=1 Tax=Cheilinus undulatus TaxID=241271 RepID=UPI001BD492B0|nr:tissue factor-like [Cheilinus undulatus]